MTSLVDLALDAACATSPPVTSAEAMARAVEMTACAGSREQIRQLQAELAHAGRVSMLGEVSASIAHELSQPLAAIMIMGAASLRWLNRPEPDLDDLRFQIGRMMEDARRAAAIIERVRGMATKAAPEREILAMDDIIADVTQFLEPEIQARSAVVVHKPADSVPPIFGDRVQLQQLVGNLCINAMQAAGTSDRPERRIAIMTSLRAPNVICCTIEDNGPGVSPDHADQVFDSFFTTKQGGMGLGLAICRSIVMSHGGTITVDNKSSLGGARFSFLLPAAEADLDASMKGIS